MCVLVSLTLFSYLFVYKVCMCVCVYNGCLSKYIHKQFSLLICLRLLHFIYKLKFEISDTGDEILEVWLYLLDWNYDADKMMNFY